MSLLIKSGLDHVLISVLGRSISPLSIHFISSVHSAPNRTCSDCPRPPKYGGLGPAELRRLRQLEEENGRLKQIVADLTLDKQMLQDVLKKL